MNQNTALPVSIGSPKRTGISTVKCTSIRLPPNAMQLSPIAIRFPVQHLPLLPRHKRPGVSATTRWSSWTRQAQLLDHLRAHLVGMHWPSKGPHPMCTLEIGNPLSFLYHLGDVHGLKINEKQQSRLTSASLGWIPEDRGQKRKAEDVAGRERLSKQPETTLHISLPTTNLRMSPSFRVPCQRLPLLLTLMSLVCTMYRSCLAAKRRHRQSLWTRAR